MKINVLTILLVISVFAAQAQDRVTKASIVGKWKISTIAVPNLMYYDVVKDSFNIVSSIHRSKKLEGDDSSIIDKVQKEMYDESKKSLISGFIKEGKPMMYIFDTNEMVSCGFSMEALESCAYIFDEKNAIMIMRYLKPNEVNSNLEVKYNVSVKNSLMVLETVIMSNKLILVFQKIE